MDIPIAPSKKMDEAVEEGKTQERKIIRMPYDFRQMVEYEIGDFVYARTLDGSIIALSIEGAYHDDAQADDLRAYVTTEVYNMIVAPKATVADVEPVQGITLGCDPELILIDSAGMVIPASGFLRKNGQVGYDGLLLELRPMPSTSEETVAYNINNLLGLMRHRIPRRDIRAISVSAYHGNAKITPKFTQYVKLTTGFHLHYGLPRELLGYPKRFIADQIVKALDYYVGIPATMPEGIADSYRRTVPYLEYGKPGTYRLDNRTLEYRVPGGILLRHPIWTIGLLGLGAAVIEDIVARLKHHSDDFRRLADVGNDGAIRLLYPNLPSAMEIFRCICSPTTDAARSHLDTISSDVAKMVSYNKRATSINNFFNTLENNYPVDTEINWWRYYGKGQSGKVDVLSASF